MAPIMHSLSHTLESEPDHQPEKAGRYLALVGAHANLITAAMFLTGMAANPLISKAASDVFGVEFGWGLWALGGIVPGLIGLALLPLLIHKLIKPTLEHTPEAQDSARNELKEMGPMSWKEKVMMFTLILMLTLWVTKAFHGFSTTLVAWIGVSILLLTQTEKWSRIIGNDKAWDTLIWLGGLLTMANMLKQYGFIDWFANEVQHLVTGFNPIVVVVLLGLIYFYSMYGFSMLTAHISAMAASFLAVCLAANAPPMLSIGLFAYFSCLCACLTNYSTGPVVVYFGLGYVHTRTWFSVGFVVSLFHMVIWLGVGMVWWKIIGWY